ncbi:hypothetical protein C1X69_11295 [Pseudomonas sp. FW305-67]|nr:hypothetical protein C1X70_17560 [Pseudomonas sp. FW305-53]PMY88412.1 hypothetical protein C1X68_04080 [Pseudomonas sp. FW303-C2]PMY93647.1 hypothetical protein C1X67_06825 [Pseudomonas sp. FW305-62]PNA41238.1 hypothetical protein C1X71_20420 [Pseudomonas sp. FW306-2-2C-A10BC]PNA86626.1 hypothetical protein C1X66_11305 [Pseudomonas sp. MPR-R3B]PNB21340.1 hypothetical protein C1X69_11295 [Pseudomonas sp. FW305-67]
MARELAPAGLRSRPLGFQSKGAASHPSGTLRRSDKLPRHTADYSRNNPSGWHTGRLFGPGA